MITSNTKVNSNSSLALCNTSLSFLSTSTALFLTIKVCLSLFSISSAVGGSLRFPLTQAALTERSKIGHQSDLILHFVHVLYRLKMKSTSFTVFTFCQWHMVSEFTKPVIFIHQKCTWNNYRNLKGKPEKKCTENLRLMGKK